MFSFHGYSCNCGCARQYGQYIDYLREAQKMQQQAQYLSILDSYASAPETRQEKKPNKLLLLLR